MSRILHPELPLYVADKDTFRPPHELFKVDLAAGRYYYRPTRGHQILWYLSVTTLVKNVLPTSEYLVNWKIEQGSPEAAHEAMMEAAWYGDIMHGQMLDFVIYQKWNPDNLQPFIDNYIQHNQLSVHGSLRRSYYDKCVSDMIAWTQFCHDVNLTPVAVEYPLFSDSKRVAGRTDLIAALDTKIKGHHGEVYKSGPRKGKPKETYKTIRVRTMIDLKSGRKNFYEGHEVQLQIYKDLWEETFAEYPIQRIYNWSPKDWRSDAGYNFRDQTGKHSEKLMEHYYGIGLEKNLADPTKKIKEINGEVKFGEEPNYAVKRLEEKIAGDVHYNFTKAGRRRAAIAKRLAQSGDTAQRNEQGQSA